MDREKALELLNRNVKNKNLRKHCLAAEAVMGGLARRLGREPGPWELAGLLHDLDYDRTADDFSRHGYETLELLAGEQVPAEALKAVLAHTGHVACETDMDRALYAADPLTGLLAAAALMHPDKKLAAIDAEFVLRRFGEKRFAAGADRDQIRTCSGLGLELEEFVAVALESMQKIADQLGL